MIGMDDGRKVGRLLVAIAALVAVGSPPVVSAQATRTPRGKAATAPPADPKTRLNPDVPRFEEAIVPVNPTDPIAVVNKEVITRRELADEAVARKGKEILETLIARRLIDQALRERKLEVTPGEIDLEIDQVAMRMAGIGREAWLRTLDKERGISPVQYARDIIYPTIALRKLSVGRIQVTDQDMKDALEANFGAKLYCRIITVERERTAVEIWEELKKNPAGFEKVARDRSTDEATRALGGLLTVPLSRHATPRNVTDEAFEQLVDGDKDDKDPSHKPKDGDVTGPIQVNESAWILVKRERVDPARQYDPKDAHVRTALYKQIYDGKLQEAMKTVMTDLMRTSEIDNRLAGTIKFANENERASAQGAQDRNVKLMSGDSGAPSGRANSGDAQAPTGRASGTTVPVRPGGPPPGLPSELANPVGPLKPSAGSPR